MQIVVINDTLLTNSAKSLKLELPRYISGGIGSADTWLF